MVTAIVLISAETNRIPDLAQQIDPCAGMLQGRPLSEGDLGGQDLVRGRVRPE